MPIHHNIFTFSYFIYIKYDIKTLYLRILVIYYHIAKYSSDAIIYPQDNNGCQAMFNWRIIIIFMLKYINMFLCRNARKIHVSTQSIWYVSLKHTLTLTHIFYFRIFCYRAWFTSPLKISFVLNVPFTCLQ